MRATSVLVVSVMMVGMLAMALPAATRAGPLDEKAFVGTWYNDYEADRFFFEWFDDGTGVGWYEADDGSKYEVNDFEWKLEDGKYLLRYDGDVSWTKCDYDFSSDYRTLWIDDGSGDFELTREGMPCTGCCCCTSVLLPVGVTALIAVVVARRVSPGSSR